MNVGLALSTNHTLHPPSQPLHHMTNITTRQRQRADFLVELLETEEAKHVAKRRGITDRAYIPRLQACLEAHASLQEEQRRGRALKYTDEMLQLARDELMRGDDCIWSKKAFVDSLIEDGILPDGSSVHGFWAAFVPYMEQHGLQLVYGIQRLTFAMSSTHARQRLIWCREHQQVLTSSTVGDYWFTDEIALQYGPPPSSKSLAVPLSALLVFAAMPAA